MTTETCLRYNEGKPELCYLLSFNGASALNALPASLTQLAYWYQGGGDSTLRNALLAILDELPGDRWVQLCRVSEFGARKYTRGNYLKGSPWSSICNSLMRHVLAVDVGQEIDPDSGLPHAGHIAWNCAFLLHCVRCFPELDDRLRAPELVFVPSAGWPPVAPRATL